MIPLERAFEALDSIRTIQVTGRVSEVVGLVVRALAAGVHVALWDGRSDDGQPLPSGNYLCTLEVLDEVQNVGLTMSTSLSRQTKVITLLK